MSCLIDYIGLKGCSTEIPPSGIYLNSLPGISLESIDKIAEAEQVSYAGVWADVQAEAESEFLMDFMEEINKCVQLSPYCDYEQMICDNLQFLTNAWKWALGYKLMIYRLYSPRLNRFTTVDIKHAAELRDFYGEEYHRALAQAAKLVDTSSCCVPCTNNPTAVYWLP